jgi:hypothetical protein
MKSILTPRSAYKYKPPPPKVQVKAPTSLDWENRANELECVLSNLIKRWYASEELFELATEIKEAEIALEGIGR